MSRVLWVDDDSDRERDAANLSRYVNGLRVDWKHPALIERENFDLQPYNLALLDYVLNKQPNAREEKYPRTGLSLASAIRERRSDLPLFAFSGNAAELSSTFQAATAGFLFDGAFSLEELQDPSAGRRINGLADGYRLLATMGTSTNQVEDIARLLRAPSSAKPTLMELLQQDYLTSPDARIGPVRGLASWVRSVLLVTPGPLRDEVFTAASLGLTPIGFRRFASQFRSAQYSGVFAAASPGLWWSREVERVLMKGLPASASSSGVLSRIAVERLHPPPRFRVICPVCLEKFPDTVATTSSGGFPAAVHLRCSSHHPAKPERMYFDEPRLYAIPSR